MSDLFVALGYEQPRLGLAEVCMRLRHNSAARDACSEALDRCAGALPPMLFSNDTSQQSAASWALVWAGACDVGPPAHPDTLGRLFALWRHSGNTELSRTALRALANQPVGSREDKQRCGAVPSSDIQDTLMAYHRLEPYIAKPAALIVAWYTRALEDDVIDARARSLGAYQHPVTTRRLAELRNRIGLTRATL